MIFLIDSGHGGMISGKYTTANSKQYTFPNGITVYEGVINRLVKKYVLELGAKAGIRMIDVCPTEVDLRLNIRTDYVNSLAKSFGPNNCLLISLHSNAGKGTGFEIWTTSGDDMSDVYATMFIELFAKKFPKIRLRKDISDGDPDKESQFYIQKYSICPSILPEWMFFDNWSDYEIISSPIEQKLYAEMIVEFCISINN